MTLVRSRPCRLLLLQYLLDFLLKHDWRSGRVLGSNIAANFLFLFLFFGHFSLLCWRHLIALVVRSNQSQVAFVTYSDLVLDSGLFSNLGSLFPFLLVLALLHHKFIILRKLLFAHAHDRWIHAFIIYTVMLFDFLYHMVVGDNLIPTVLNLLQKLSFSRFSNFLLKSYLHALLKSQWIRFTEANVLLCDHLGQLRTDLDRFRLVEWKLFGIENFRLPSQQVRFRSHATQEYVVEALASRYWGHSTSLRRFFLLSTEWIWLAGLPARI